MEGTGRKCKTSPNTMDEIEGFAVKTLKLERAQSGYETILVPGRKGN